MKTKHIILSTTLSLMLCLIYSGCHKSDRDENKDTSTASDNTDAQGAFSGIWKEIGEIVDSTFQLRNTSCATYTLSNPDTVTWPKTLTINFGTTNCVCGDGNNRRGIIMATFTGKYRTPGTVITVTLSNYYHNDMNVQGTQIITNNGLNTAGNLVYNTVVNNATVTTPGGNITWSTNQNREWIAGAATYTNPWDDVYLITGTANGTGTKGNTFNVTVNTPLRVELSCRYIVSGTFTVTPANYSSISLNYGSGGCDNKAVATINGKDYDVTLK